MSTSTDDPARAQADVRAVGARTIIRNADWIVAHDEARDSHKYVLGGDIVFEGDTLIHVGGRYDGDVTRTVDGRGLLVMPGLIDAHVHAHRDIHAKGFFEDLATRHMWMTQLLEYTFVLKGDESSCKWLHDIGVLGSNVLLGHAINIDRHPWINHHEHGDMERLAGSGVTVINCARAFAQWGDMLRSHGSYRAAGVNIALGTDGYPHDMIEEMRISGLVSKVASGNVDLLRTEHVYEAATLGGARALGRNDLGRLSVGARADIVLVDLAHSSMRPVRDPLRSLVYSGVASAVRDVYVGGDLVVKGGEVLTIDEDAALEQLQAGQSRAMGRVKDLDWAGREADEMSPLCLPVEGPAHDNDPPDAPGKPTFQRPALRSDPCRE